jgi:prepilin-type N-terminal cleavage/methylation domain-containing protein
MDSAMKTAFAIRRKQSGFSLIEVLISMVILTVGLLGVLATLEYAMAATQTSQEDMLARQVASEAMESIFNARDTSQLGFSAIANTTNPPGIFIGTPSPLLCAGPDGILGTADDAPCMTASGAECPNGGVECLTEPGPDGILGTADDVIISLNNFTRTITITPYNQTLNLVTITIVYTVPNLGHTKTYVFSEYISYYH